MLTKKINHICMMAFFLGLPFNAMSAEEDEEEVIVTGVAQPTTVLNSSNSVTHLSTEDISNFTPRSTAEIFRNLPGIQAEATGGDSNANIKVRGIPISAGGSRYLSIQEDGLPALLIGDFDFATSDSFIRVDNSLRSVQSIRGGAASTQAANSAGGIVNFISRYGDEKGGAFSITSGIDFESDRFDFSYGSPLENDWSFYVSGYGRKGEGVREAPDDIEDGIQLRGNLSKDFDNGYVRFFMKHLDERTPTYLPIPAFATGNGSFSEIGVDFDDGTLYLNGSDPGRGGRINSLTTGFESKFDSFGVEGEYDFTDRTTVGGKFRYADIDGSFVSPFPTGAVETSPGSRVFTSTNAIVFNTDLDSLDNLFLDGFVRHDFGAVTVKAGIFYAEQDYDSTWSFNSLSIPLPLDPNVFTANGIDTGVCCDFDFEIENIAPTLTLTGDIADFTWDASIRQDNYEVEGDWRNGGGLTGDADYDFDYVSWSLGGNYRLHDNHAVFANVSEGGSAIAPSRVANANSIEVGPGGDLLDEELGYTEVMQAELGYKYSGNSAFLNATAFYTETEERGQFEITSGATTSNEYESYGLEVEGGYDFGNGFEVIGSFTLTDSEITDTITLDTNGNSIEGNTPRRQADYIFNITPTYRWGNNSVGLNFVGTDEVYVRDDNAETFDDFIVTNAFINYNPFSTLYVSLNVNNLFDEEGFTEGEDDGSYEGGREVRIRPINGRTVSAKVRFDF